MDDETFLSEVIQPPMPVDSADEWQPVFPRIEDFAGDLRLDWRPVLSFRRSIHDVWRPAVELGRFFSYNTRGIRRHDAKG